MVLTIERGTIAPLILSVVDQALLSAFSLVLNLILIRVWLPELFGVFSVILAISMIAYSVQYALVGTQLVVLRAQAFNRDDEARLLAPLWMANCVLTAALVVVTWAGMALVWQDRFPMLPIAAALFVAGTLTREYVRIFLFSEFRARTVLTIDAIYIAACTAALILVWLWRGDFEVFHICIAMALVSIVVSVFPVLSRAHLFSFRFDQFTRTGYGRIWREQSRWALLGAITYELATRAHIFIVGAFFGAAAVGILQAGEMIFRPLRLILQAWARIAQPTFARLAASGDLSASQRLAHFSAVGFALLSILFTMSSWAGWSVLETHVFREAYANVHVVVMLWGLAMIPRLVSGVYSTQLQGLARFWELCLIGSTAAFVVLVSLAFVVAFGSFEWSIIAVAGGALVDFGLATLVLSRIRNHREGLP